MIDNLFFLIILILVSAFFSASEIAIFSLSQAKIKSLEKKKVRNAKQLAALRAKPQRLLINILIGNNLVNIGASSMAAVIAWQIFGNIGPAIATAVLTILILVFGEIGPKTLASANAERFSLAIAPILTLIDIIFRPVSIWFEFFNKLAIKYLAGGRARPSMTEEELTALAEIGAEEGVVEPKEKEMIKRILEFNDINAEDVMRVRSDIFALPQNLTLRQALSEINEAHYSRVPIFERTIDNITGVIYLPDILRELTAGNDDLPILKISRKPYFIPLQRKIDDIFKDFQRRHNHIAIVLDGQGNTAGLVTLEDLLEEIVGEIMDESDVDESLIKRIDKKAILVDAQTEIRNINNFFNINIPGQPHDFVAEAFLEKFGRIPKPGDEALFENFKMVIEKATKKKIEKIRIIKF
ncbi:MAG: hemolysin family protein [Patescibacteria group bacterium]|jgi:CBS domain containing-hemolysin-like protein|nr:hemolysin family protein [Patescibacteria group bacterium]